MLLRKSVTWILIALGLAGALTAALSIARAGIGWDAPVDAQAVAQIQAIPADASLEQAYEQVFWTSEFYGILISQLADTAHSWITGSTQALDASNLATYRWQAGVTVVIAIAGAAALGLAVGRALRSSLAGAFAWALTMTTPVYLGSSHVNFKDIPVAAGLSLVSSGMIMSSVGSARARWIYGIPLTTIGAIVALGARVAAWPLVLAIMVGSLTAYAILSKRQGRLSNMRPALGAVISTFPLTLLFLWLTNPFARLDLPRWLLDSVVVMREYPMDLIVRVAGSDFATTQLPWWYLPAWLFAQLPLLTLLALLWTGVCVIAGLAALRWAAPRSQLLVLTPLFIQGLVLPLAIVGSGSVVYDALRHLLFMFPALTALAAIGVAALERIASDRATMLNVAALSAASAVVIASLWASVRWMPYSYAFINPIAGWNSSERDWELDYWGVSAIEGVRILQQAGYPAVAVQPTASTSDIVGGMWRDQARSAAPDGYGLYVFKRWDESIGTCESLFTIRRDRQILGEGAQCTKWDG